MYIGLPVSIAWQYQFLIVKRTQSHHSLYIDEITVAIENG